MTIFRASDRVLPVFLNCVIRSDIIRKKLRGIIKGIHIYPKDIRNIQIPLPPLAVQREIVEEVEGYQRVIDGARAVVESWRPRVWVDPAWEVVRVGDILQKSSDAVLPETLPRDRWSM